jgi:basic membrane protein A
VGAYFARIYQPRYFSGMVGGFMTRTNRIGYVAASPVPEVIRGINAFTLGARSVNPEVEVHVLWVNQWSGRVSEREASVELIEAGADVLAGHLDSPVIQGAVAKEKGVYFIGYHSDSSEISADAHLVSAVWKWIPLYESVVREVRSGTWKSSSRWLDMKSGAVDLSPYGAVVPQNVRDAVDARKREIIAGNDVVFQGPVKDQRGRVRIAEGARPADKELAEMNWFVEGVVGEIGTN